MVADQNKRKSTNYMLNKKRGVNKRVVVLINRI